MPCKHLSADGRRSGWDAQDVPQDTAALTPPLASLCAFPIQPDASDRETWSGYKYTVSEDVKPGGGGGGSSMLSKVMTEQVY
jgi:hypothetical protein